MDKITAKQRDRAWEEVKNAREKVELGKISHQLVGLSELRKMWLEMSKKHPEECIVLMADGSIYQGSRSNVRVEKMRNTHAAYKTEEHTDLVSVQSDMKSAEEMYPIAFNGARASKWDTRTRLASGSPNRGKGRSKEIATPTVAADDI